MKNVLLMTILGLLLMSCGKNSEKQNEISSIEPLVDQGYSWIDGSWEKSEINGEYEISINTISNKVKVKQSFQVGSDETPSVPFGTVCRYETIGEVIQVNKVTDIEKRSSDLGAELSSGSNLSYEVSSIKLIDGVDRSGNKIANDYECKFFINNQRKLIKEGGYMMNLNLYQLTKDTLIGNHNEVYLKVNK